MVQFIEAMEAVEIESAFFRDDQLAILGGARRNGFLYDGAPRTTGFSAVREPGRALALLLYLSDGRVVTGDCVEVQYAGAAGREAPMHPATGRALLEDVLQPALLERDVADFRRLSESLRARALPAWMRYGASQALLRAAAHIRRLPMAGVVCEDWGLPVPDRGVPIFAQCGDSVWDAVDRMIMKRVDALPHGLVNNVDARLGRDGGLLLDLVARLRDRILAIAGDDEYRPVLHFDVYGTVGLAFRGIESIAAYLARLERVARPFAMRIEHPLDAGGRDAQIAQLGALRVALRDRGCGVQIVADEWCNSVEDVVAFSEARCVDMIQVKTPDLGGLDESIEALLTCKQHGIQAYCGGTCNETVASAQATAHVALACAADLAVAKPGMGVDEGLSVLRNEIAVARAQLQRSVLRVGASEGEA